MEKTEMMKRYEAETGNEAIDYLTEYPFGDYTRWLEAKAAAYDRVMSGEPKHCPFCHGEIKPIDHPPFWMAINGSQIDVYVDGLGAMATTINYCPMCGRRLTLPDGWEEREGE